MKKSLLLIGLFLLVACVEQEARKPIYRSNDKGMGQSIDRNKKINAQQQELFKKTIEKDSTLTYYSSPLGYWFAYKNKTQATSETCWSNKANKKLKKANKDKLIIPAP